MGFQVASGTRAKSLNQTSDSVKKLEQGRLTEVEIIDGDPIVASTLKDVTQSVSTKGNNRSLEDYRFKDGT